MSFTHVIYTVAVMLRCILYIYASFGQISEVSHQKFFFRLYYVFLHVDSKSVIRIWGTVGTRNTFFLVFLFGAKVTVNFNTN